ncbi:MAG: hypothetical protein JJT90_12185 [Ectothiorhodospiraceae bacterium]|nr:hypothetical protein [Ectothiorhodospiraceae bacterium]
MRQRLLLLTALLLAIPWAAADTVIESRQRDGALTETAISGDWIRMAGRGSGYLLLNAASGEFLAVFPAAREVLDLAYDLPPLGVLEQAPEQRHALRLYRVGEGPVIAGHPTEHYRLSANGMICAEYWLSTKALELPEIANYLNGYRSFHRRQRAALQLQGLTYSACEDAEHYASGQFRTLGLPMRIRNADGETLHEVSGIYTGLRLPAGYFDVPDGYRRVSPNQ